MAVFEKEIQRAGKEFLGKVFAPTGTKDHSTYITKIRQANPDGLYVYGNAERLFGNRGR